MPNFGASFFHGNSDVSILTKNRLGYIFGDCFKNSSGHPACVFLRLDQLIQANKAVIEKEQQGKELYAEEKINN
jgi:hypothetical protein